MQRNMIPISPACENLATRRFQIPQCNAQPFQETEGDVRCVFDVTPRIEHDHHVAKARRTLTGYETTARRQLFSEFGSGSAPSQTGAHRDAKRRGYTC